MRHLKLSTRIHQKIKACKKCLGKGSYWTVINGFRIHCSCAHCCDWKIVLRDVRKLELDLKRAERMNDQCIAWAD